MTQPQPRMIQRPIQYYGCLGFLLSSCRGYRAFNADGQSIAGDFESRDGGRGDRVGKAGHRKIKLIGERPPVGVSLIANNHVPPLTPMSPRTSKAASDIFIGAAPVC